jgi:hypothetical protein
MAMPLGWRHARSRPARRVPFLFGLYVLRWRGIRRLDMGEGLAGRGLGIVFAFTGTWFGLKEGGEGA